MIRPVAEAEERRGSAGGGAAARVPGRLRKDPAA